MTLSQITNYIEDDWGDNQLKNRSDSKDGYFLHPSDNLISDYEAGDVLKGIYRPKWNILEEHSDGVNATGGKLVLSAGGGGGSGDQNRINTAQVLDTGSWYIDISCDSQNSNGSMYVFFLRNSVTNDYAGIQIKTDGNAFHLLINGSYSIRTNWSGATTFSVKATRDSYGNYEIFRNGNSQGTAINKSKIDSDRFYLYNALTTDVYFDNLEVK